MSKPTRMRITLEVVFSSAHQQTHNISKEHFQYNILKHLKILYIGYSNNIFNETF